ncbi:DeoR/GlpR transcriptional regulator [Oscillospiraceae bacterium NSJ-64]|uniref:DeoR/GlpR transcriptional regulator n=2 Tax=Youxingia wuxianensis TaxID=2763678 RepID=A0A926EMF0_9FIRM|nr:DeoR/GlpR transcriptional regulator [Youxingia wuxianensis]
MTEMLAITRRNEIKDILLTQKSITVTELSQQFEVTEETIRRDLKLLEENGFLTRTYGGAYIEEGSVTQLEEELKQTSNLSGYQRIAKKCTQFIKNGDCIFLDSSNISISLCEQIQSMHLTVLTNSLKVINYLCAFQNIRLVSLGGNYSPAYQCFCGRGALTGLSNYHLDTAFLSCASLDIVHGLTDTSETTAQLRSAVLDHSKNTFLIADSTKFDRTSFHTIGSLDKVDAVITDIRLPERWKQASKDRQFQLFECCEPI